MNSFIPQKHFFYIVCISLLATFSSIRVTGQELRSPNGQLKMTFSLSNTGTPTYELSYKNKQVIKPSHLGLELKDAPNLMNGFSVENVQTSSFMIHGRPFGVK